MPRSRSSLVGALAGVVAVASSVISACYSTGDGTPPPGNLLYFPVGLAVSQGGNVLYVANSDFDLQWNGGTLQSYDLHLIRKHAVLAIANPTDPNLPLIDVPPNGAANACPGDPPLFRPNGWRKPLGETCSPPVDSTFYVRDSAVIGAFATDLQALHHVDPALRPDFTRLFAPVRGDASLSWADVVADDKVAAPGEHATANDYAPFALDCGVRVKGRCDAAHHAGNSPDEPGNSRRYTMPGEPFGMAISEDGAAIAITHQTATETSLFSTGFSGDPKNGAVVRPSLQFVLEGVALGGNGISAIPHDPDAFPFCATDPAACPPRPAFLQTSRVVAELDLLRYYSDEGFQASSSLARPFLTKEATYSLTANAGGTDSRGIVIDPTPRLACKLRVDPNAPDAIEQRAVCARKAARVFFANRSPASMLVGEIGEPSAHGDETFDADRLIIYQNVPLTFGPSRLYLAPIVDASGNYALRVFIVCFDSATIFIYDPDADQIENIIRVGTGPFALAFDPFTLADVALRKPVPADDPRDPGLGIKPYRFMYIASFTKSFVQLVDLDNSRSDKSTFERVVYTLGEPTLPKGTK